MTALASLLAHRAGQLTATPKRVWGSTFVVLAFFYLTTAHWYGIQNIDSMAAAWPGWEFVRHGDVWLENIRQLPPLPWFNEVNGHLVSNRTPGVIVIGIPAQFLLLPLHADGPLAASTLTAALITAAAIANLAVLARRLGLGPGGAICGALLLGLGTGFWGNASAELWPHGPDALWLSFAMLAMTGDRLLLAGLALGAAELTRPHLGVVALALAAASMSVKRAWLPVVRLLGPSVLAAGLLLAWNRAVFGKASFEGGYQAHLANAEKYTWSDTAYHAVGSLFSPLRGLFVFSPFVALALVLIWRNRYKLPYWTLGLAVGGIAYECVQWRFTSFEGGTGFYGYRYPLEAVLLLFPAGILAAQSSGPGMLRVLRVLAGFSVATTVIGSFFFRPGIVSDPNPWRTWGLVAAVDDRGPASALVAVALFGSIWGLVSCLPLPRSPAFVPDTEVCHDSGRP